MVYDNIKKECELRKISIHKLEVDSGLPNGTINKWRNSSPTVASLKKVADALKVSVDWLLKV